jgi:protein-glutamine gamma-glutamyltransferase
VIATRRLRLLRQGVVLNMVLVGFAACATAGGSAALVAAAGAVGVLLGQLLGGVGGPAALRRWRIGNVMALVVCAGTAALGGASPLLVGLALVGWLLVHRAWVGREPGDARVALLLALLLSLLACILSVSPWLAPLFTLATVATPLALVLIHLEEAASERAVFARATDARLGGLWGLAPVSLVLTVVFFASIPRTGGAGLGGRDGGADMVGFGQEVELGDLGAILDNPDVVLRARIRDMAGRPRTGPFYFRGVALDHFDGQSWRATLPGEVPGTTQVRLPPDAVGVLVQSVVLESGTEGVLFGVADVVAITGLSGVRADISGAWRWSGSSRRLEYTAHSLQPQPGATVAPGDRGLNPTQLRLEDRALRSGMWTSLPPGLDPRIGALAQRLVGEAGPDADSLEIARVMERHLREAYVYTDVPHVEDARQPLSDFLFRSRRGHCEFFATALAVLLRNAGVPSRVVNGFYGGEYNDFGEFVLVRQSDAHSWVEAWVEGQGWVQLDATPAATVPAQSAALVRAAQWAAEGWHRLVLDYDLDTQLDGLAMIATAVPRLRIPGADWSELSPAGGRGVVLLGVAGVILVGLRQFARWLAGGRAVPIARRRERVAREHARARALITRRRWAVPPGLPPVAAAEWLVQRAGPTAVPLKELAWLLYRVRYGGEDDRSLASDARRARRALGQLPRRRRAWGQPLHAPRDRG